MNIVLCKEMVIATDLTYKQGCEALEKASKNLAMTGFTFALTNEFSKKSLYTLIARNNELVKKFIAEPETFVISVEKNHE